MDRTITEKNLLEEAYHLLFPHAKENKIFRVVYSGRLKDFGGNIRMSGDMLELKLSRRFHGISREIQIGLAQELLCRLFKRGKKTMYIDLYNSFVKNLHIAIPKNRTHPRLEESFDRVNLTYFLGLVERPNLVWGAVSKSTLGTYDFKTDTIKISKIFLNSEERLLDYVMFHEMLHKQRKFEVRGLTTRYHDSKFKRAEKVFKDSEQLEKELNRFASRARVKSFFGLE
ncbi:MAG: SprT-like domain-containing protein [Nanoarchaeota archaeon]|nr:SprT-like domain-containing protein [Nanoarchaeota archaeon]